MSVWPLLGLRWTLETALTFNLLPTPPSIPIPVAHLLTEPVQCLLQSASFNLFISSGVLAVLLLVKHNTRKLAIFRAYFISLVVMLPFIYGLMVLLGAPVFSGFISNTAFALYLTTILINPLYYWDECNTEATIPTTIPSQFISFYSSKLHGLTSCQKCLVSEAIFTLIGAWCGSFVMPLDWQRPWQCWPIPNTFSTMIGRFIGILFAFIWTIIFTKKTGKQKTT